MTKIKLFKKEKKLTGLTLIELLIAMTILLICIFFITPVFVDTLKTYTASTEQMTRLRDLSNLIQQATNDLKTSRLNIKSPATPFPGNTLSPTMTNPLVLEISTNDTGGKEYAGYKFDSTANKAYKIRSLYSTLTPELTKDIINNIYNMKFGLYSTVSSTYMEIYAETKTTKNKIYNIQNRVYLHDNI